jgi:hypothetical protein
LPFLSFHSRVADPNIGIAEPLGQPFDRLEERSCSSRYLWHVEQTSFPVHRPHS